MGLLFYASNLNGTGKRLWDLQQDLAADYTTAFCQTIDGLALRLRQDHGNPKIAVLLAGSRKELLEILSVRDLLNNRFRLILILPDNKKDTVKKGHSLYPRFLTYVDGNFDWVAAVLEKMLKNNHAGLKGELWQINR